MTLPRTVVPFSKFMRYPYTVLGRISAPTKNSVSGVVKFVSVFPFTIGADTGEQEVAEGH